MKPLLSILLVALLIVDSAWAHSLRSLSSEDQGRSKEQDPTPPPIADKFLQDPSFVSGHDHSEDEEHEGLIACGHAHHRRESPSATSAITSVRTAQLSNADTSEDLVIGNIHIMTWDQVVALFQGSPVITEQTGSSDKIVVPTFYHVIENKRSPKDAEIRQQHKDLNDAFALTPFQFVLREITRTKNNAWWGYSGYNTKEEITMKSTLRRGGAGTLNVYINKANGRCGYTYLPKMYKSFPENDGVVINDGCFVEGPGGALTHEVGHWFGLLHTVGRLSCTIMSPSTIYTDL